jgi:hypothetical protein
MPQNAPVGISPPANFTAKRTKYSGTHLVK